MAFKYGKGNQDVTGVTIHESPKATAAAAAKKGGKRATFIKGAMAGAKMGNSLMPKSKREKARDLMRRRRSS